MGAFYLYESFLVDPAVEKVLLTANFLTKTYLSSLVNPNNFLSLEALLGPNLLGFGLSVKLGISAAPFLTMTTDKTLISGPTMQPLTVFLFLSPSVLGL